MVKELISSILKYGVGAMVIGLTLASAWPWYLKWTEDKQAAQSLPSIMSAGQAIKLYEQDYEKLPNPRNWIQSSSKYKDILPDPTYTNLTKISQPNNPGWAMNARIGLSIGDTKGETQYISSEFPNNAILLTPSFDPAVFPERNGYLPKQPLSIKNDISTQHGLRLGSKLGQSGISGLYLLNDGSIKQLSLNNAQLLLQLRPTPPSKKSIDKLKSIDPKLSNTLKWEKNKDVETFKDHVSIKSSEINTPLIPISNQGLTVNIETKSDRESPFVVTAKFYNKYKMPINIETKDGKPLLSTTLTENYSDEGQIYTKDSISNGPDTILAFNPSYGYAHPITTAKKESYYIKKKNIYSTQIPRMKINISRGTEVSLFKNWEKSWTLTANNKWQAFPITINLEEMPLETKYVGLQIENKTYVPLLVKDVKLGTGN